MLYSLYPSEGIVFAADSRIIRRGATDQRAEPRPKVLRVRRVGITTGLVGYYGLAQVRGQPMSEWLSSLIGNWSGSRNPEDFADLVVERLNSDARESERKQVSGFHFGAFRRASGRVEPVFFHIVNTHGFDETTGLHTNPGDTWRCQEQLMGRDVINFGWDPTKIRHHLRDQQRTSGIAHWYRNGDMPLFGPITGFLNVAIAHVVRMPGYGAPTTLSGWERIAHAFVVTTSQLARAYYRGAVPTIGDAARVRSVEWPAG